MKFTNGIRIATANKSLCGKTLLSKLIILIIGFVSVLSVASVIVKPIFYSVELGNIGNTLRNVIKDFILMESVVDNSYGATFKLQFTELFALIKSLIIFFKINWDGSNPLLLGNITALLFGILFSKNPQLSETVL